MKKFLYLCLFGTALAGGVALGQPAASVSLPTASVPGVYDIGTVAVESTYITATAASSAVSQTARVVGQPIAQGTGKLSSYFVDAAGNVTPGAGDFVGSASSAVSSAATTTADVSALTAQNVAEGMNYGAAMDAANAAINAGGEQLAASLGQPASSGGFWSSLGGSIKDGYNSIKDTWNNVTNSISNSFQGAWVTDVVTIGGKSFVNMGTAVGSSLTGDAAEYASTLFVDGTGKIFEQGADITENALDSLTEISSERAVEKLVAEGASEEVAKQAVKDAQAQAAAAISPDKATVFNVIQYAIVILQALEGTKQEDITKEVTVKAGEMQDSQGSPTSSELGQVASSIPDTPLSATSITGAAETMIALLQNNPVYMDLLSDEICLNTGSSSGSGTSSGQTVEDTRKTDAYMRCVKNRRLAFANTVALSAQVIAEGSNAISAEFYDRIKVLTTAAQSTIGTLGAMSVVNDSERFPYFEMVRGSALSAVQLQLKAASTLSELTGTIGEANE